MDIPITIDCPSCASGKVRTSMADVAKGRKVRCSRGCSIQLEDDGGGARKADRAMKDLDKAIKRLGR